MSPMLQRMAGMLMLGLAGPLILIIAAAVRLGSPGPAFHRATRTRPGGTFTLYKLRSMRSSSATSGLGVTAGGDPRVTSLGRLLRRTKLDELPQLWNVARGDMLLVGPRPEDPQYVDLAVPSHALVFGAMPGMTGAASVAYRDEERVLAGAGLAVARGAGRSAATPVDIDRAYRETVLPAKLAIEAEYLERRSTRVDLGILARTLLG